jgi:SAM-dependent methyltransferase
LGVYTQYTAAWLDRRYSKVGADGVYHAHMPIFGLNHPASEAGHPVRFGIVYRVLRELARLEFDDLLIVGGGEGFVTRAAEVAFGVHAVDLDLSHESCQRAHDAFGAAGVAADATRLPFPDGAFDVVLCSEVLEHLEFPIEALLELERVARRAVVLTTLEYERDPAAIARHRFQRCGYPHFEQNLFAESDFVLAYGPHTRRASTLRQPIPAAVADERELRAWLPGATAAESLEDGGAGITLVHELVPSRRAPRRSDAELLDDLLLRTPVAATRFAPRRRSSAPADLVARCVCPVTHAPLRAEGARLVTASGRSYAVENGVPVLYDLHHPDPTAEEFTARVASRPERAALLALRRDTVGVGEPGRTRYDLAEPQQRRSWRLGPSVEELTGHGRGLCLLAHDADPFVVAPVVGRRCGDVLGVRLAMRVHAPQHAATHGTGQIFWLRAGDDDFEEARSKTFAVANSPEVREYRVDLAREFAEARSADELLVLVRVDPADATCAIELLEFELLVR